jgi:hypothetical protein
MSARYTLEEFEDAETKPCYQCRLLPLPVNGTMMYMACDYHEGFIDGYERGAKDNR